ncbi:MULTISPECIES: hypothetical protein [Leptolyngbya]|nr:hypothetical protein [Leptolyngbya sp. FACHB-1624]
MRTLQQKMIDGLIRFTPALLPPQRQYYNEMNNDLGLLNMCFQASETVIS